MCDKLVNNNIKQIFSLKSSSNWYQNPSKSCIENALKMRKIWVGGGVFVLVCVGGGEQLVNDVILPTLCREC